MCFRLAKLLNLVNVLIKLVKMVVLLLFHIKWIDYHLKKKGNLVFICVKDKILPNVSYSSLLILYLDPG